MAFQVKRSELNQRTFIHLINDDEITATIIPSVGAMLHEFRISVNGHEHNLIDGYSTEEDIPNTINWFKGVKLSPWPCRIPGGAYTFKNETFHLKKMFRDGSALHGLLFDQPFRIVDEFADEECAYIVLRHHYMGEDEGYPFEYNCEVKYALHPGNVLEVETTVTNLTNDEIPIADGWHPYFQLGGKVDDWQMVFQAKAMVEFNEKLIPTGKLLPYHHFNQPQLIGDIQMDNCFVLDQKPNMAVCSLHNPGNGLTIHFFTDANYPYLQIFIPSHRTSIAIENLSGAPDCFNNQMGLIVLKPGNSQTFRVFYQVEVVENN